MNSSASTSTSTVSLANNKVFLNYNDYCYFCVWVVSLFTLTNYYTCMVMDYCMGNNNGSLYLWCAHFTYSGLYNNNDWYYVHPLPCSHVFTTPNSSINRLLRYSLIYPGNSSTDFKRVFQINFWSSECCNKRYFYTRSQQKEVFHDDII